MIRFLYPTFLWLLALLPLIAILRGQRGEVAAVKYSSADIARQVARETRSRAGRWQLLLTLLALALLIVGLARPQFGRSTTTVQASGVDMILAMDCSGSMEALDFKIDGQPISRLDIVKSVVSKFIDARPNDRIGLIGFAGAPYLVSPLTLDHDWLQQNLERVKIGSVEDGTAIGSALATSVNRLRDQPSKSKIVVLLTDGQNNAGKIIPETAAQAAKAMGVKVYTIAAGVRGEAPIPVTDAFGNKRLAMAQVDVDEDTLKKIAAETGGKFFRATDTESLKNIYGEIDRLEKTTHQLKKFEHHTELFAWTVVPAFAVLGLGIGLGHTRFRHLP
ncbi:MAG TPA: VWA domain-containing protein [Candidatus Dormibacteraeota bacterium]|nr:VWA domain-containing protein [Candidatus Dormibacteraeota bacterium]